MSLRAETVRLGYLYKPRMKEDRSTATSQGVLLAMPCV